MKVFLKRRKLEKQSPFKLAFMFATSGFATYLLTKDPDLSSLVGMSQLFLGLSYNFLLKRKEELQKRRASSFSPESYADSTAQQPHNTLLLNEDYNPQNALDLPSSNNNWEDFLIPNNPPNTLQGHIEWKKLDARLKKEQQNNMPLNLPPLEKEKLWDERDLV